jgi:hypothetical protein
MDHNGMAVHLTRVTVNGFKKCCTSNAVEGTDVGMLWDGSKEHEDVRRECEEGEGTD